MDSSGLSNSGGLLPLTASWIMGQNLRQQITQYCLQAVDLQEYSHPLPGKRRFHHPRTPRDN